MLTSAEKLCDIITVLLLVPTEVASCLDGGATAADNTDTLNVVREESIPPAEQTNFVLLHGLVHCMSL